MTIKPKNHQQKLIRVMKEISIMTEPECAKTCRAPHSCCDAIYCEIAIETALDEYGVTMQRTGHATLPLMGETGCTAAPHFRPICTVHTCDINSLGFKRGDEAWTKKYFRLRNKAEELVDMPL